MAARKVEGAGVVGGQALHGVASACVLQYHRRSLLLWLEA
jgi:hypothetical protein